MTAAQLKTICQHLTPDANYGMNGEVVGLEAHEASRNECASWDYPLGTVKLQTGVEIPGDDVESRTTWVFIAPDGTELNWYEV